MTEIVVEPDEFVVLQNWKKRGDTLVLPRLKAEAVIYASLGVGVDVIAASVDRSRATVLEWLNAWRLWRLSSIVTGHAGNENAAKLTRAQKTELREVLALPPSQAGIEANFWDVPALADVVQARFDVCYESDSSYQLLMRFLGMSFKKADPFDKRRDEKAITERMEVIKDQVRTLIAQGYEVYTLDEVRVEHESETRRMWLPRGQRSKIYLDRKKASCSFFAGA